MNDQTKWMKSSTRCGLWILAGLVALYLIVFGILSIQPAVQDNDLRASRETIAPELNGLTVLQEAVGRVWWPEDSSEALNDLLRNTNWNASLASVFVQSNRPVLKLLDEALALPSMQFPELRVTDDISYLGALKKIAQTAGIQANALFHDGREREAFAEALKIVRLGRRVEEGRGVVIHYLVGSAIKAVGLWRIREFTATTHLAPGELVEIAAELNKVPSDGSALVETLKAEYQYEVARLLDMRSGGSPQANELGWLTRVKWAPVYNHGKTRQLFAANTRALIESADLPYSKAKLLNLDRRPGMVRLLLSGNAVGQTLFYLSAPVIQKSLASKHRGNVDVEATRVLLAMRACQMQTGRVPADLAALTPGFLKTVPADAFDGEPLRYSVEKKVIYSVNEDLKDDGGSIERTGSSSKRLDYGLDVKF